MSTPTELRDYQSSPAGLVEAHLAGLVLTVSELKRRADDLVLLQAMAAEIAGFEAVRAEIGDLICRMRQSHRVAA